MENIEQMSKRHKDEVRALEESCPHTEMSLWTLDDRYHDQVYVKFCKNCGKVSEREDGQEVKYFSCYK